jgi:chlorophyll synthase
VSLRAYLELSRPFTLVAPALGIATGAVTAYGAEDGPAVTGRALLGVAVATVAAAILNAASNALNQVADRQIDAVNKPARPIPSGRLTPAQVLRFSVVCYLLAVGSSFAAGPWAGALFAVGGLLSVLYSVGPRLKRYWLAANVTIALARGLFLKVAAWATVRPPDGVEPWLIGGIIAAYTFGAINTKDYADVAGDRAQGIRTLVGLRGPRQTAWISAPFFVLPFVAIPALAWTGLLTGSAVGLTVLGLGLALWGAHAVRLVLQDPEGLTRENHPSWRHMYLIMFVLQIGFAVAYHLWDVP